MKKKAKKKTLLVKKINWYDDGKFLNNTRQDNDF